MKELTGPKPVKVAVGVPSGDMIHADFAMCLINMVLVSASNNIQVGIINQKSSVIEIGRAKIVEEAKKMEADYLLFLDSDMMFPPNLLVELISQKVKVVCCDALRRRFPYTQMVTTFKKKPINYDKNPKRLEKLIGGTTCVQLIHMKVFDNIEKPYFLVTYDKKSGEYLGEDYYFTQILNAAKIPTYCDTFLSRQIVHIGTRQCKIGAMK